MKGVILLAAVGLVAGECPNACSGHGECGAYDMCSCYQMYQGNDCSERTCYFGIAHVDSPKGDLNSDGVVSGPLTTVITGSEVYPWGTTEQFPNANPNEGHFYMECSNKGLCNRETGLCECFDGYDGTACVRASCPSGCSGHGTCESIKELAEMRSFDTNKNDAPTSPAAGGTLNAEYDSAVEESYSYDLWDHDKSMACKCDPGYFAADCSLKKCKYGVDPLYFDHTDGVQYQTTVIHLGSIGSGKGDLSGSFKIVFYDVFGERYVTRGIEASYATGTAAAVVAALEALPNKIIRRRSNDVTGVNPTAVEVSKAVKTGTLNFQPGTGGGAVGETGAGLGARGSMGTAHGVEYTVRFTSNPGVLKSLEVDTQQVNNPGTADYWVADQRKGQFSTRYTTSLGRVNNIEHGSNLLYTNDDLSGHVTTNTMIKVGGQEFRVTAIDWYKLTLSEPYVGGQILPVLTDTGVSVNALSTTLLTVGGCAGGTNTDCTSVGTSGVAEATCIATVCTGALASGCSADTSPKCVWTAATGTTDELTPTAAIATNEIALQLTAGAKLYAGSCSYISADSDVGLNTNNVLVEQGHDCLTDQLTGGKVLYRRADDTGNQNIYKTADTAVATDPLLVKRGSSEVYVVGPLYDGAATPLPLFAKSYAAGTTKFVFDAAAGATGTVAIDTPVFVNGHGPIKATTAVADTNTELVCTGNEPTQLFGADFSGAKYPVVKAVSDTKSISAGTILALNGRRYKVKSVGAQDVVSNAKITLTENYAGGSLIEVCSSCVSKVPADGLHITTSKRVATQVGDKLLVGDLVHEDLAMTVAFVGTHGSNGYAQTAQKTSAGTHYGDIANPNMVTCTGGTDNACTDLGQATQAVCEAATCTGVIANGCSDNTTPKCVYNAAGVAAVVEPTTSAAYKSLYKISNGNAIGFTGSIVTESADTASFQYVAQCSNRGNCDTSAGICDCYAGYGSDNCDLQNMLAM
eukprot:g3281.t1